MGGILLVLAGPRAYAQLASALDPPFHLKRLDSSSALHLHLRRDRGVAACILDPVGFPHALSPPFLRRLRRIRPQMAVVAASDFTDQEVELFHLGQAGVEGVLRWETHPSPREIRAAVETALAAAQGKAVIQSVTRPLEPAAARAVQWSIVHADTGVKVSDLAATLALSERSLRAMLRRQGLPGPRRLLLWGRLLRACALLERGGETVESTALRLGYATGSALRRALKNRLGCTPSSLSHGKGSDLAVEALVRELSKVSPPPP